MHSHQFSIAFTVESSREDGDSLSRAELLCALLRRVAEIATEGELSEAYCLLDSVELQPVAEGVEVTPLCLGCGGPGPFIRGFCAARSKMQHSKEDRSFEVCSMFNGAVIEDGLTESEAEEMAKNVVHWRVRRTEEIVVVDPPDIARARRRAAEQEDR